MHRIAMMHLLWKLAQQGTSKSEKEDTWHSAVKLSLSLRVPSAFTSVMAVRMEQSDIEHRGKARKTRDRTGWGK